MALSPKERADFDQIVSRLRLEDTGIDDIPARRRSMAILVGVVAATLVFGLGVALAGQGMFGPVLIVLALLGAGGYALWTWARPRLRGGSGR
ncbi:MAG TPA: hypothetical protein VGH99_03920 [Pseudonocardia sp.]|jgi:hypothetical protein